jgi:hypothetical protein
MRTSRLGSPVPILLQKSQNTRRRFFEKNEAKLFSPFNMTPRPLAKPPVSLSLGDEVPHIFIRESHQRPRKKFDHGGKQLLQQNLPEGDLSKCSKSSILFDFTPSDRAIRGLSFDEKSVGEGAGLHRPPDRTFRRRSLLRPCDLPGWRIDPLGSRMSAAHHL